MNSKSEIGKSVFMQSPTGFEKTQIMLAYLIDAFKSRTTGNKVLIMVNTRQQLVQMVGEVSVVLDILNFETSRPVTLGVYHSVKSLKELNVKHTWE